MRDVSTEHFSILKCRLLNTVFLLLSFAIPFFLLMISLAGMHITPFGDKTLVISDANAYYINTLSYAGRMFKGLEGLTYSF